MGKPRVKRTGFPRRLGKEEVFTMPKLISLAALLFLVGLAGAREKDTAKKPAKVATAAAKGPLISEQKAITFIRERLESATGMRGWSIHFKGDATATGKEVSATLKDRS